jgi:hypothetical protein
MNKYRNIKVKVGAKTLDSKKEARRYQELMLLEKAGIIKELQAQVRYELQPSYKIKNKTIRAIIYVADFVYKENETLVIEDVKGFRNEVYKIKKKLFEFKYGIEIKET